MDVGALQQGARVFFIKASAEEDGGGGESEHAK